MCGITGFYSPKGRQNIALAEMVQSLAHRGPDAQESKVFHQGERPVAGLATARLSIVGLDNGGQPVSDPTGRWWVSLNGEIYNHQTLRREAIGNDVHPENDSDTAVIAALLSFLPIERVLDRLRGMFGLAIYDKETHRIWLYRDRMGVKPLYWIRDTDGTLFWSSELRALKELHSHQVNALAVQHLLCFEYIPAPLTIWEGLQKLQPSMVLSQQGTEHSLEPYWQFPVQNPDSGGSIIHWQKSLRMALESATQLRLQADVPVGTMLSGGIDSATITYLASLKQPNIHSFSVIIEEDGFTEEDAIRQNLEALPVTPHLHHFRKDDFLENYEKIKAHLDEPLADSSLLVTWFLFSKIQEFGIRCVLSGDGADEVFGGYPTHLAHQFLPDGFRIPCTLRKKLKYIPSSTKGVSWDYMLKRFADSHQPEWWKRHQLWNGAWFPWEVNGTEDLWSIAQNHAQHAGSDKAGRALFLDQRLYMAEGVLSKVDRASMAHGVEVRSPFLDQYIISMAADIPMEHKINRHGGKQILRSLLPDFPVKMQRRKKKGFGSPIGTWLRTDFAHLLDNLPEALEAWIEPAVLQRTIQEHLSGKTDHRRRLWTAIMLRDFLEQPNS